jgi:hypothetical protein
MAAGEPDLAAFRCPHCNALVDESHKPGMVAGAGDHFKEKGHPFEPPLFCDYAATDTLTHLVERHQKPSFSIASRISLGEPYPKRFGSSGSIFNELFSSHHGAPSAGKLEPDLSGVRAVIVLSEDTK